MKTNAQILDYATPRNTRKPRTTLAICIAVVGCGIAGSMLAFAGTWFFPAWFVLSVISPVTCCAIATDRKVFVGALTSVSMMGGLLAIVLWRELFGNDLRSIGSLLGVVAGVCCTIGTGIGYLSDSDRSLRHHDE